MRINDNAFRFVIKYLHIRQLYFCYQFENHDKLTKESKNVFWSWRSQNKDKFVIKVKGWLNEILINLRIFISFRGNRR